MKNISTLERMSVKNEKNATILELPNEIDLSDFLDQSRYRDHFNKDEINKLNLLTGDLKGIEFGDGFNAVELLGSQHNDLFLKDGKTKSNHSGGIVGGISNGMPIIFRTAFKPVATLLKDQISINSQGEEVVLSGKGRHDACVVPRAVVIVEAMTAIVLLDHLMRNNVVKY